MNNNNNNGRDDDDEFGDPSFLMDVDLDAIASSSASTTTTTTTRTHKTAAPPLPPPESDPTISGSGQSPSSKRRKVVSVNKNKPTNTLIHNNNDNNGGGGGGVEAVELEKTLSKYFGYPQFRGGQLDVIQKIVQQQQHQDEPNSSSGRDVAVFWATGQGKSLCYQIPALHTKKITIVVSPLISLMQDQVHKLNGLMPANDSSTATGELATFLGSGQTDMTKERAALQGQYLLVYVTPEKLLSPGFLDQLATLHTTQREIGLFAVDESHCVSEWGHDFRPVFRDIGKALRTIKRAPPTLRPIPIMALTATAVPRVQQDICRSLYLRNPTINRQSFDRSNLIISVMKKDRGSMALASAMEPLVQTLVQSEPQQRSTIIYVPTRNQVDEMVNFLRQRLLQQSNSNDSKNINSKDSSTTNNIRVEGYHAGMSNQERSNAHTNFLTGRTSVICATVAFGMGIDKPDTRRVIHYGPPKTVEEYYQQIGRAGRDGIKAECIMYVSELDFDKYKSDFYMGRLQGPAKEATLASLGSLKSYALDVTNCRRKALLDFFQEMPSFGERCGTCDNCKKCATLDKNDLERDFGNLGARVVLQAVDALNEPGMSTIMSVISGKAVEQYRYKRGIAESRVKELIISKKNELSKKVSQDGYREFIVPLTQRRYLKESTKSAVVSGFSRSWTTYTLTPKGNAALDNASVSIVLPVPESLLEAERKEKARRERVLVQLQESGVQLEKLPQEEIEAGDGDVIRAFSKWKSYLESMRRNGKEDRITQLEELLAALENFRSETAVQHRMAPGTVLAEQTLLTLAYTTATMPPGMKMEASDLVAAGVRTREMDSLCQVLSQWVGKYQNSPTSVENNHQAGVESMRLVPGQIVKTENPWEYALYKPIKKTGLASWESSYNRFSQGESPQTIALSPENGRPIQVQTVCGHVMQAMLYGKGVELHRLAQFLPPPTSNEWEQLQAAEISTGMDVCGNPVNCGIGGDKFTKTEFLRPIMGDAFIDTPYTDREEKDKAKFGKWCNHLEWYMTLRRIGQQPTFAPV